LSMCTRHDDGRHLELAIPASQRGGRGCHQDGICSACLELRWSQRKLGREFDLEARWYGSGRKKLSKHPRFQGTSKQRGNRVAQQIANDGSRGCQGCQHVSAEGWEIVAGKQDQASHVGWVVERQRERHQCSPGMSDHDRLFDVKLNERLVHEISLSFWCPHLRPWP